MDKLLEVARRRFHLGAIAIIATTALLTTACGGGGDGGSHTDSTSDPSGELLSRFRSTFDPSGSVAYNYSIGALPNGGLGTVLDQSGEYYTNLADSFNPSKGYTPSEKLAYMNDLIVSEEMATDASFDRKVAQTASTTYTGVLGVVANLASTDTSSRVSDIKVAWTKATRRRINLSKFQQYVQDGILDPNLIAKLRTMNYSIYGDTLEIDGLTVDADFMGQLKNTAGEEVKVGTPPMLSVGFNVENSAENAKHYKMTALAPAIIGMKRVSGAVIVPGRGTDISIPEIPAHAHYAPGSMVNVKSYLRDDQGQPLANMPIRVSLHYTRGGIEDLQEFISYPGTTDASGACTISLQLWYVDADYYLHSEFQGTSSYTPSESLHAEMIIGNPHP